MPQNHPPESIAAPAVLAEERRLHKDLGFWALTAIGFSNILGSGWLFAAMYAAQTAGPAALLSWIAAGVLCALIALVMVELGATRPEGGGTVRWPLYASGRLVGTMIGWSVLLSVGGTAAEISAIMQYAAHYLPGLYSGGTLTVSGLAVAVALSVVLTVCNWFAVRIFARLNNLISVFKVVVPIVTIVALFLSGTHSGRLTDHGGFAPYGYAACLTALAGGGIVYSVNGFQAPLDFSGQARNPRRNVPAAVLFLLQRRADGGASLGVELRRGAWLVVHLAALTALSWLGTFGGSARLPAPYDTVVVGVLALAVFGWAVRAGAQHLRTSQISAVSP